MIVFRGFRRAGPLDFPPVGRIRGGPTGRGEGRGGEAHGNNINGTPSHDANYWNRFWTYGCTLHEYSVLVFNGFANNNNVQVIVARGHHVQNDRHRYDKQIRKVPRRIRQPGDGHDADRLYGPLREDDHQVLRHEHPVGDQRIGGLLTFSVLNHTRFINNHSNNTRIVNQLPDRCLWRNIERCTWQTRRSIRTGTVCLENTKIRFRRATAARQSSDKRYTHKWRPRKLRRPDPNTAERKARLAYFSQALLSDIGSTRTAKYAMRP